MRNILSILFFVVISLASKSQVVNETIEGTVSFVTTQNVYVKFQSTKDLKVGDTLFVLNPEGLTGALVINNLSSISCICTPINSVSLKVSDTVSAKFKAEEPIVPEKTVEASGILINEIQDENDSISEEKNTPKEIKQDIFGRIALSSYYNFSNADADNTLRTRATLSFNVNNISNSKLSFESYLSYVYSNVKWNDIQINLFNGLKVYNLAFRYDFNESTHLSLGRKINPLISSLGAIDGLHFEKGVKSFYFGAIAGSRPDYDDYSYNFKLFEYGAYFGHAYKNKNGSMQSTIAYVNQENDWKTDRRFMYFQHTNSLVKNLYFFGSIELDLYKKVNDQPQNTLNLSNLYLMLRYNITRKLSVTASYTNRQNIIYYETYKDFLERLLESSALQGYRLMVNYRPFRKFSVGARAGYRFMKQDPRPTKDLYAYMTYSQIPFLKAAATFSYTIIQSSYISGNVYSLGLTRDLIPGKVSTGLSYRFVDYNYYSGELSTKQNIGEVDITWRIIDKLSFSVFYEGTFEQSLTFNRVYVNFGYRF